MAYSKEVKEKVLEALKQGNTVSEINDATGVSVATINNWKKEAGLTKSRGKSVGEIQQTEKVQEIESKEPATETKGEAHPEVTKDGKQETRQRLIDKWKQVITNGSDEEKVDVLKERIKLEPKNEILIKRTISYLIKLGRDKEAQQYQSKLECWQQIKTNRSNKEKTTAVIEVLTRRLEILPSDEKSRRYLANFLIIRGKLQDAQRVLNEGLKLNKNNIYFLTGLSKIAKKQGNIEEATRLNLEVLDHEPDHIGALQFLLNNSKSEDRVVYATRIQRLIKSGRYKGGVSDLKKLDEFSRRYAIDVTGLEDDDKSKEKEDSIFQFRTQIKQGNVSAEDAEEMLKELENDHSIRATALKAEIHIRVFSNPKGAKKIVEKRLRLEGTTSKEKKSLTQIAEIIRRAEKGINPRELETIR